MAGRQTVHLSVTWVQKIKRSETARLIKENKTPCMFREKLVVFSEKAAGTSSAAWPKRGEKGREKTNLKSYVPKES